jgi:hypothetical protein
MTRAFIAAILLTFSTACTTAEAELQINNLRTGLVCPPVEPRDGSICVETTQIPVTGEGRCVYDGQEHRCTWHGFEFEYANARPSDEISCVVTSNHDVNIGNPTGVEQEGVSRYDYPLRLQGRAGRYFHPQYTVFDPDTAPAIVTENTICSLGDRELFRFRSELMFGSHPSNRRRAHHD